jgi:hypothetical protein
MRRPNNRSFLLLCLLSVFSVTLWFVPASYGASPALGGISPRGGQRGTEMTLTFSGGRLSDAKEILFYSPGFTVTKLAAVNDNAVQATVKIAADCRLGEHPARVRTASGISELRTFWVGALPVVEEKEPNSDFAAPQKIQMNVTVVGVVQYEDVDYFSVELKKGQRLSVEIEAMRLANTLFDPYVAILDSKRFELATSDDSALLGQDGLCSIVAPADGTYVVQVRDSGYQGNGACQYRLHVGSFPRPLAVVPSGGKAGDEIEVKFLGDPRGPFTQKVKLPAKAGEPFGVFAQDKEGIAPSAIPFRVSDVGNVIETEPNDTHDKATPAELPLAINGVIDKDGDVDWFKFKAKKGQTFDVHCYARQIGSPLDPVLTLAYAGGGNLTVVEASNRDCYVRITFPEDREYVIGVKDFLGKGGAAYTYRVEFTPVELTATLSIPKVALYSQERQTIAVPKGNRMATLISVSRANFGGEVTLGADKLPAGLTMNAENVAANLDVVPVVFEASASAQVGGELVNLTAKHADAKHPKINSRFSQVVELITGPPGQSVYWKYEPDRAAIAVTEEAPFSIEIVEPKVPLVQNGSMQLKIVAKRRSDFKGPITVYPLFNPPGVSSASAVLMPANANEVLLPMNAAANAQAKKWKTAVLASADAGKGPVWTSSQLATIEVAAPFVTANMERGAVEQGKETDLLVKLAYLTPFEGKAKIRLLGLPFKVTTPEMEFTKDTKEVLFKITTDKTSPAGQHRNLFCQVQITRDNEPILANTGYSELRIDVPIVKTTPAPTPTPNPMTKPVPPPTTPPKRLTRLEKLRLEQEEREKEMNKGAPPPKK